jgi:alkanesulfonate monooxygenase SsuD/methylene tetrahydromethanopterin reductase-like flavin-dependent oxidoreductase (luciferase family)
VGRLGDGWLPSFCTADDVREGWEVVAATAAEHGRTIDPEHLGALVTYSHVGVPDRVAALLAARRPGLAPAEVVPVGLDALRARLEGLIAAGASKFVVVPIDEPGQWDAELAAVMDALGDLQT